VIDAAGAKPTSTMIVGGGARSTFWAQMIADATGLTIDLAESAEAGAALGAARLAMLAAGAGDEATVCARPAIDRSFAPHAKRAALSAPRLHRYRALYRAEKAARG
jgi:xylulokinase